jgi:hypothetical protein
VAAADAQQYDMFVLDALAGRDVNNVQLHQIVDQALAAARLGAWLTKQAAEKNR